jgi:hypothetical protein
MGLFELDVGRSTFSEHARGPKYSARVANSSQTRAASRAVAA